VPARPRDCTVCRECIRGKSGDGNKWSDLVTIHRVMDHFICACQERRGFLPCIAWSD